MWHAFLLDERSYSLDDDFLSFHAVERVRPVLFRPDELRCFRHGLRKGYLLFKDSGSKKEHSQAVRSIQNHTIRITLCLLR